LKPLAVAGSGVTGEPPTETTVWIDPSPVLVILIGLPKISAAL
jgi:hypothetical protein